MCCCPKPNRNGEPGYSWDGKVFGTHEPVAPSLHEAETLLFDEPGRCSPQINGDGSTDYHSHHYRLVGVRHGGFRLLVRHGGGEERVSLGYSYRRIADLVAMLPSSDARYLFLHALYTIHQEASDAARETEANRWRAAAADGRLKKRRYPKRDTTRVWIEEGPRTYDVSA